MKKFEYMPKYDGLWINEDSLLIDGRLLYRGQKVKLTEEGAKNYLSQLSTWDKNHGDYFTLLKKVEDKGIGGSITTSFGDWSLHKDLTTRWNQNSPWDKGFVHEEIEVTFEYPDTLKQFELSQRFDARYLESIEVKPVPADIQLVIQEALKKGRRGSTHKLIPTIVFLILVCMLGTILYRFVSSIY